MPLKTFNEFHDLGHEAIWTDGKVGSVIAAKAKPSKTNLRTEPNDDWRQRQAKHRQIEKKATPSDLIPHTVKALSDNKAHKDYTVHHIKGKDGDYDTALLHHAKKGFVGMMNGEKHKDGFHVSESFISPAHRGKGLGVAMYEHAATHHKGIVSDGTLSVHSQRIYGHFAKQGRVKIFHQLYHKGPLGDSTGEPVTATEKTKVTRRSGRNPTVKKTVAFSSPTHANLGKAGSAVRMRIEPLKKGKKSK